MTKLILVRHGYSSSNKKKIFTGQSDVPLDSIGVLQAQTLKRHVLENYKIDSIYSSDLCRAYDTVAPIADALHLTINTLPALREIDVGFWQGLSGEEIRARYNSNFELYMKTPGVVTFDGGESYEDMQKRALCAVEKIVEENNGKTVLVATHGGVIRALTALWSGAGLDSVQNFPTVLNASITTVYYENGEFKLVDIGTSDYLDEIS